MTDQAELVDVEGPPRCGAPVTRCTGCTNTVAATLDECPRCGGSELVESTCRRQPMRDRARCNYHGGRTVMAVRRAAADAVEQEVERMLLADLAVLDGSGAPLHPFDRLDRRARISHEVCDRLQSALGELGSATQLDSFGIERERVLLQKFGEWSDRAQKYDEAQVRLDLDARRVQLEVAQARLAFKAVRGALRAVLPSDLVEEVQRAVLAEMRAVTVPPAALGAGGDGEADAEVLG